LRPSGTARSTAPCRKAAINGPLPTVIAISVNATFVGDEAWRKTPQIRVREKRDDCWLNASHGNFYHMIYILYQRFKATPYD